MQFLIDKQDKHKSGIYIIINKINGKIYIGSAKDFAIRFQSHKDAFKAKKQNPHFQRALEKYGIENFIFSLLEFCNLNILLKREQWYLDSFAPYNDKIGYNINPTAGSCLGVKHTPEQIEANRQRALARKYSEENRQKQINARGQNFVICSPEGVVYKDRGVGAFAEKHGLNFRGLRKVLKGQQNNVAGWTLPGVEPKNLISKDDVYLLNPVGELIHIGYRKINKFAKQHNLDCSQVHCVWKKQLRQVRGWCHPDNKNYYVNLIHESGKTEIICRFYLSEFTKKYGLDPSGTSKLVRGEAKSHKGWRIKL